MRNGRGPRNKIFGLAICFLIPRNFLLPEQGTVGGVKSIKSPRGHASAHINVEVAFFSAKDDRLKECDQNDSVCNDGCMNFFGVDGFKETVLLHLWNGLPVWVAGIRPNRSSISQVQSGNFQTVTEKSNAF